MVSVTACTNWTIKYIQIYNFQESKWYLSAGTEYTTQLKYTDYYAYNSSTNAYDRTSYTEGPIIQESGLYDYPEDMKTWAARAYEYGSGENRYLDKIEKVDYQYGEEIVITHYRWTEGLGYEPE